MENLDREVRHLMSSPVISITPDTLLTDAYALLSARKIRRLPVVDAAGAVVGIVTLGDVRGAGGAAETEAVPRIRADGYMTPNPIVVQADAPVAHAAGLMLDHKIGGLPVIEHGRLVGMITESDIFKMLVSRALIKRPA